MGAEGVFKTGDRNNYTFAGESGGEAYRLKYER